MDAAPHNRANWTLSSIEKPHDIETVSEEPMILDERIATTSFVLAASKNNRED